MAIKPKLIDHLYAFLDHMVRLKMLIKVALY